MNCHIQVNAEPVSSLCQKRGGEKALCFDVVSYIHPQLLSFLLIDGAAPVQLDGSVFVFVLFVLEDGSLMAMVEKLDTPEDVRER